MEELYRTRITNDRGEASEALGPGTETCCTLARQKERHRTTTSNGLGQRLVARSSRNENSPLPYDVPRVPSSPAGLKHGLKRCSSKGAPSINRRRQPGRS